MERPTSGDKYIYILEQNGKDSPLSSAKSNMQSKNTESDFTTIVKHLLNNVTELEFVCNAERLILYKYRCAKPAGHAQDDGDQ